MSAFFIYRWNRRRAYGGGAQEQPLSPNPAFVCEASVVPAGCLTSPRSRLPARALVKPNSACPATPKISLSLDWHRCWGSGYFSNDPCTQVAEDNGNLLSFYPKRKEDLLIKINFLPKQWVGFPHSSVGKESACNTWDPGLIPGLGRSPGEGKGLKTSMDCIVHVVAKSWTRLRTFTHSLTHSIQG